MSKDENFVVIHSLGRIWLRNFKNIEKETQVVSKFYILVHNNFKDTPCGSQGLWMVLKSISKEWSWNFLYNPFSRIIQTMKFLEMGRHTKVNQVKISKSDINNWTHATL